jgi:hypothetical protein
VRWQAPACGPSRPTHQSSPANEANFRASSPRSIVPLTEELLGRAIIWQPNHIHTEIDARAASQMASPQRARMPLNWPESRPSLLERGVCSAKSDARNSGWSCGWLAGPSYRVHTRPTGTPTCRQSDLCGRSASLRRTRVERGPRRSRRQGRRSQRWRTGQPTGQVAGSVVVEATRHACDLASEAMVGGIRAAAVANTPIGGEQLAGDRVAGCIPHDVGAADSAAGDKDRVVPPIAIANRTPLVF